jgi:hypothetical protein
MSKSFIDGFIKIKADFQQYEIDWGIPCFEDVVVRKTKTPSTEIDIRISPKPFVQRVSPKMVGAEISSTATSDIINYGHKGGKGLYIKAGDYVVSRINRIYEPDSIFNDVDYWVLYAKLDFRGQLIGGLQCDPYFVDLKDSILEYSIILRMRPEQLKTVDPRQNITNEQP